MPPAIRDIGAASFVLSTTATVVRPALPASWEIDDVLLLLISQTGGLVSDITSLGSYASLGGRDNSANVGILLGWERATGGSTAPSISIDNQATDPTILQIVSIRDALASGNPFGTPAFRTNAASTTSTADTVTPPENNCGVLFAIASNGNVGASAYSGSNPAFTEVFDTGTASNTGAALALAFGTQTTAAATGSRTATLSAGVTNATALLAIRPAAVVAPPSRRIALLGVG